MTTRDITLDQGLARVPFPPLFFNYTTCIKMSWGGPTPKTSMYTKKSANRTEI